LFIYELSRDYWRYWSRNFWSSF